MFRGLLVRSFSSSARFDAAKSIWKKAQAVCFDVDSTVISSEGIDELAKFAGVDVSEITRK